MSAPAICVISGVLYDVNGSPLPNTIVVFDMPQQIISGVIMGGITSTKSDATGAITPIALPQTAVIQVTIAQGMRVTGIVPASSAADISGILAGSVFTGTIVTINGVDILSPNQGLNLINGTNINVSNPTGADVRFDVTGQISVPHGGTGVATLAAHGVVLGEGVSPVAVVAPGTAGYVLTSNGASADPTYQVAPGAAGTTTPGTPDKAVQYDNAGVFGGVPLNTTATPEYLKQVSSGTPGFAQVAESELSVTDITTNDVTSTKHGFAPKSLADTTKFLNSDTTPQYVHVKDSDLAVSDITTNDVSNSLHGFAPKSPGDTTKFLNGAPTPDYAQVKDSDLVLTDITTNDASASKHGFLPKLSGVATDVLYGNGTFAALPAAPVVPTYVLKANDQSVSNNTPVDDNELKVSIGANQTWAFRFVVIYDGVSGGDIFVSVKGPTSATGIWSASGIDVAATSPGNFKSVGVTSVGGIAGQTFGCSGTTVWSTVSIEGAVSTGGTAGTLLLRWAQVTTNGTATVVKAGSRLEATKIS